MRNHNISGTYSYQSLRQLEDEIDRLHEGERERLQLRKQVVLLQDNVRHLGGTLQEDLTLLQTARDRVSRMSASLQYVDLFTEHNLNIFIENQN